jgi:hypothetical protein
LHQNMYLSFYCHFFRRIQADMFWLMLRWQINALHSECSYGFHLTSSPRASRRFTYATSVQRCQSANLMQGMPKISDLTTGQITSLVLDLQGQGPLPTHPKTPKSWRCCVTSTHREAFAFERFGSGAQNNRAKGLDTVCKGALST